MVREPWEPECKYFIVNQKKKKNIKRKKCYYRNGFTWKRLKKKEEEGGKKEKKKKRPVMYCSLSWFLCQPPAEPIPPRWDVSASPARRGLARSPCATGTASPAPPPAPPVPPQGHGTVPTGRSAGSCSARVAAGHSGGGEGQPLQAPGQPFWGGGHLGSGLGAPPLLT